MSTNTFLIIGTVAEGYNPGTMPEGDTIYRTAVQLRKALQGQRVTGFESQIAQVRALSLDYPVIGRVVSEVEARGKHLLVHFAPTEGLNSVPQPPVLVLRTHMRMTGSWHLYRTGERWWKPADRARVVIRTEGFVAPCFNPPVVELMTEREARNHPDLRRLGPDTITEEFDPAEAKRRLQRRGELPIGVALMDQQLLSGVGNVFKSEILFIRRVSPFTRVEALGEGVLDGLIEESHRLLVLNRERGQRQTRFTLNEKDRLWVYGRSGEGCRVCGEAIKMRRQGEDARSTYYCPACQAPAVGELVIGN